MKLKVLAGLHAGALVDLHGPLILIGRGEQCDLILTDESVEPLHLILSVEGSAVRVRVCNGCAARIDGEPVAREAVWLPGGQLDLNGVELELVHDDGLEQAFCGPEAWTEDGSGSAQPTGALEPAAAPASAPSHRNSWSARTASGVVCLCCAVMVLGVTFRELPAQPGRAAVSPVAWNTTTLTERLAQGGFKDLKTSADAAGMLVLTGHVADDQALQSLRNQLVEPLRTGRLRLRVETLASYAQTLNQQIDDPGVQARFVSARQLLLKGEATRPGTQSKIIRLQQELGADFEIDAQISYEPSVKATAGPIPQKVPMQIAHVSGGSQPSIVTQAGEQYFQGAKLEDGTEVVSITTEKVVLRYGDKVVEYRFE